MQDDSTSVKALQEMKLTALRILETLKSADAVDVQNAMKEYAALVVASIGSEKI